VTARRRQLEISVERPLGARGPEGAVARLSATFDAGPDGEGPSSSDLAKALDQLLQELEGVLGPSLGALPASRNDRELEELVQTYRPRQRELVDALLADGELSAGEHQSLLAALPALSSAPRPAAHAPPGASPASVVPNVGETPIAAVPIVAEPKLPAARPVPELLRTFQISNLRQAGAVRARRQISFAEYMALKRHFEASDGTPGGTAARSGG
jgi:hypothetical protein